MPHSVQKIANRLTFRQLQVYKAVYDLRSYSKAGEDLGLTQPAVSSQIRQLEAALKQPLFEYIGRKLYTTAAGELLYQTISGIFNELQNLQSDLAALQGKVAGELKLVAVNTAQYVVPYLLRAFLDLNPDVKISVKVVNRATALERLANNTDDLVIMGMVPEGRSLTSIPFLDNELVPVVPDGHPLLLKSNISAEEFLNSQLLLREAGSGSRLALEVFCQESRLKIPSAMELGSNDSVKHAVIAGLGVAVLPKLGLLPELQLGNLKIPKISGFPLHRSWCLVHPVNKHLSPAARAFVEYIQQNISGFNEYFARERNFKSE